MSKSGISFTHVKIELLITLVSLVAQLVKNPPAMQETWVGKIALEEGMATHSTLLAWRIPMDAGDW